MLDPTLAVDSLRGCALFARVLYALDADAFAELVGSGTGLSTRRLDLYRGALSR